MPILLPPLEEQRAIADYLDRETARIDTLIEEQQRLIEMLRERRPRSPRARSPARNDARAGGREPPAVGESIPGKLASCPAYLGRTTRKRPHAKPVPRGLVDGLLHPVGEPP